ncbi:hypothetical protein C0995_007637 [Termitomyces sp. Mi166|nr:hypothetical protein C0995_007637 [Termitomyces sp. Mi166\
MFFLQTTVRPFIRQFSASTRSQIVPPSIIRTFDPERLQSSDFLDISGKGSKIIFSEFNNGHRTSGVIHYPSKSKGAGQRFPERTQGFLYCYRDPRLPSITSELRFRVTETSDPASFKNGLDLLGLDGVLPWSIPLFHLKSPFKELAIQEGFLDFKIPSPTHWGSGTYLTFLEQPFVVNLEGAQRINVVISRKIVKILPLPPFILMALPNRLLRYESAFKGKLLVSFQQAQPTEPVNGASIVLRVLKVLEPIEPLVEDALVHYPIPTPGTLLKHRVYGRTRTREFDSQLLKLLPSITDISSMPSLSSDPEHTTSEIRKMILADRVRTISTLDPCRLRPSDFIVPSNWKRICVRWCVDPQKPAIIRYSNSTADKSCVDPGLFPPDAHGFLYMHMDPRLPPLSGQIRFRVTSSGDPAQFKNGVDLTDVHGEPWCINSSQIAHCSYVTSLKEQLHHDGYTEFVQALSYAPPAKAFRRALYYLEQPFVLNMSCRAHGLTFVLPNQLRYASLLAPFSDGRGYKTGIHPYTGRILVRFERSTLQEHEGGNFVVIRVLKILDPINLVDPHYDMYLPVPRVGSLLVNGRNEAYSRDLDKPHPMSSLKYLPSVPDVKLDM